CAYRRASLSAASFASAPELQKNTRSANVASTSFFASRSAGSLVIQLDTCQIVCAWSVNALTIAGWQCPSAVTATPLAKSMYIRPCWSQAREPSPRTGMKGAGAKQGTITSSKVARVTGSGAAFSAGTLLDGDAGVVEALGTGIAAGIIVPRSLGFRFCNSALP